MSASTALRWTGLLPLALGLSLGAGCASVEEPAPPPPRKELDLDALAARRAATSGAQLEQAAAAERSANATSLHAAAEGEPSLVELEARGEAPPPRAASINTSRDLTRSPDSDGGPSDLDKASDGTDPWINMDLVSSAIRRRQKSLQTCWDTVSMDAPSLGKRVIMTIKVDTQGGGIARLAAGSPTRHPELSSCLIATLGRVDYPEAKNGAVAFEYPLNF